MRDLKIFQNKIVKRREGGILPKQDSSDIEILSTLIPKVVYVKKNMTSVGITQKDTQIIATMGGVVKVGELPQYEMVKEVEFSFEMAVYTFSYQVDKVPLIVYDVENSIYMINGIDQFASIRKNIT